jgi:hypothetical protein
MFKRTHCVIKQPIALTFIQWWRGDIVGEDLTIIYSEDEKNIICTYFKFSNLSLRKGRLRGAGETCMMRRFFTKHF